MELRLELHHRHQVIMSEKSTSRHSALTSCSCMDQYFYVHDVRYQLIFSYLSIITFILSFLCN